MTRSEIVQDLYSDVSTLKEAKGNSESTNCVWFKESYHLLDVVVVVVAIVIVGASSLALFTRIRKK